MGARKLLTLPFAEGMETIRDHVKAQPMFVVHPAVQAWAFANRENMLAYMNAKIDAVHERTHND